MWKWSSQKHLEEVGLRLSQGQGMVRLGVERKSWTIHPLTKENKQTKKKFIIIIIKLLWAMSEKCTDKHRKCININVYVS